jgi:hypothetical protein
MGPVPFDNISGRTSRHISIALTGGFFLIMDI